MLCLNQYLQYLKSGVLVLFLCVLSSCMFTQKDGSATLAFYQAHLKSSIPAGASGLTAFQLTFYPFAQTNCASCHGGSQGPLFAVSNVANAYNAGKDASYMNFASVSNAKLAIYSGNGHCGIPSCSGNTSAAVIQLQAWADVENAITAANGNAGGGSGSGGGNMGGGGSTGGASANALISSSLALPTPLPTGNTYKVMRWPLSQLTPASPLVSGAIFEMEVQSLNATTYRVRNPRILGLTSVVKITGMHVFVKPSTDAGIGVEDLGAGSVWESDIVNAPVSTLPGTLPVGPIVTTPVVPPLDGFSMIIGVRSNQDSFTVAFDKLEASASLTATFASINLNLLIPKCLNCHNAGNPAGGIRYDSYAQTLGSVTPGNPGMSRLYGSSLGAGASMPIGGTKFTAAESAVINTWITNGALDN